MHTQRHPDERGANLVEAAMVIPLLILLLLSAVDLGRGYLTYVAMIDAAREGARCGANHPSGRRCHKALAEADGQLLPVTLSCTVPRNDHATGGTVRVEVGANLSTILGGIVGRDTLDMSYSVAFRIRCPEGKTTC